MFLKTVAFAVVTLAAVAVGGSAHAATSLRLDGAQVAASAPVVQAHWEYRHHHRFWVPDRRRDYRRR